MDDKTAFDLRLFLPYLLNQAAEASSLAFQQVYKDRYGMLRSEWRVLFHLGIYGEMTASDIAARSRIHKTKISRAVQRLVQRRFVIRRRDPQDRRAEWLSLTTAGRAAYADLRQVAQQYEADLTAGIDPAEVARLRDTLQRLAGDT